MSTSPSASASSLGQFWPVILPAAVALAYACGHLTWYLGTPLGQVPVLDERENLDLAEAIFQGALPHEAFYRAPGYALMLAALRGLGVTTSGLFPAALALGALLHACNAGLTARLALTLFGQGAACVAGLLAALHPVFVHYATQTLDAVPALSCFLLGLNFLIRASASDSDRRAWAGASLSWAAATLLRPNYLLPWAALPLLALSPLFPGPKPARVVGACSGVILFAALAGWQWQTMGTPVFLPTQGPYNFWAANQPGAHGRYYVQRVSLPAGATRQNPARAESLLLFARETGHPAGDLTEANRYWQQRSRDEIIAHPLAWIGRLGRKAYALFNNWEQYNNKTFAFHQARSPWLRWNPLSWGVLFVFGIAGFSRLTHETRRPTILLLTIFAITALSIVVFFVSARFRLPLAALLCVGAGGALAAPDFWRAWPQAAQFRLGAGLVLALGATFSNFDGVRDRTTFVQDHLLLARAAQRVGHDQQAFAEGLAAAQLAPGQPEAAELVVTSWFNLTLTTSVPADASVLRSAHTVREQAATLAPATVALAGVALAAGGEQTEALTLWRERRDANSLAALLLAGVATENERASFRARQMGESGALVRLVGDPAFSAVRARLFPHAIAP